jgi:N-acetylmuramoyl-L-alanine amidase/LGFP repeat
MRERSGPRTEHADRRHDQLSGALALATGLATGLSLLAVPSLAAPTGQAAAQARRAPVPAATPADGLEVREITVPRVSGGEATGDTAPSTARQTLSAAGDADLTEPLVASVARASTSPFSLVGLTWRRGSVPTDVAVLVRAHRAEGWSPWQELHFHPEEGPAGGEESTTRQGTEPLWVGDSDGVQTRVHSATGRAPADLQLTLVDPGSDPVVLAATSGPSGSSASSAESGALSVTPAVVTEASTASTVTVASRQPSMITRREWGANPRLRSSCDSPRRANTVKMVFVHHTVGSNNYRRSESKAIVRSIYAYHTQGQGWCDIGYNFLVDRFGRAFEGRAGGINTPVRGAHAGDYNVRTVGVSLMGNFEKRRPTRAMRRGVTRLVAWKLGSYYRYPRTRTRIAGSRFQKISGHRDAMSTACPGRFVYRWLPTLRRRVGNRIGAVETPISRRWHAMKRRGTNLGQPFRGEAGSVNGGRKTQFNRGWIYWNDRPGAHAVRGRIYQRYRRYGQAGGKLGYPRTNAWDIQGARGMGQSFQRGRIYRTRAYGARVVWGKINRRYARAGLAEGRLGVPIRNQYRTSYGWAADFKRGRIMWDTSTGRTRVRYR